MRRIFVVFVLLASAVLLGTTIECKADSATKPVMQLNVPAIICWFFGNSLCADLVDEVRTERYLVGQFYLTPVSVYEASLSDDPLTLTALGLTGGGSTGDDPVRYHNLVELQRRAKGFYLPPNLPLSFSLLNSQAAEYLSREPLNRRFKATFSDGLGYQYWDGLCGHPDPKVKAALEHAHLTCDSFKVTQALLPGDSWKNKKFHDVGPALRRIHAMGYAFDVAPPKDNPIATVWLADLIATHVLMGIVLAEFEPNGDHGSCNACTFHIFVIPKEGETPIGVLTVRSLFTQAFNSLPMNIPVLPGLNVNLRPRLTQGQSPPPLFEVVSPSGGAVTNPAVQEMVPSATPPSGQYPIQHY